MNDAMDKPVEGFRLSPQQRHTWQLLADAVPSDFAVQVAVSLSGSVDRDRLREAVASVVARHEILRTTFRCLPGMTVPVQVIGADAELVWRVGDSGTDRDAALQSEREQQGDLARGPLLRALLLPGGEQSTLVLTLPALCSDVAGAVNLVGEIARAYRGGEDSGDEPMQYADLAEWQNELLDDGEAGQRPAFALERAHFELPVADARTAGRYRPDIASKPVGAELAAGLERVAQAVGAPVSSVLAALWAAVLGRVTGQLEPVLGVVSDGRSYEGLDRALGAFARDLPLPVRLDPAVPFEQLVRDVDGAIEAVHDVGELFAWERVAARPDVAYFPFAFGYENRAVALEAGGVQLEIDAVRAVTERAAARLVVARTARGLLAELHHDAGQLAPVQAESLLDSVLAAAASAVAEPRVPVGDLELVGPAARERILHQAGPEPVPVDTDRCVHALIEARVDADPAAVAVAGRFGPLTYGELEQRANRLAHHLRGLGVRPDHRIGLCVERGPDMVVGILGILKAGAGYLPLDPGYPADRLTFMLKDAKAPVLLTHERLLSTLPPHDASTVCFDRDATALEAAAGERPDPVAGPDHLAYVIYTSGSTGRPKGVELTHRTLVHSTLAREDTYDEAPGRYLLLSSFAFDSSVAGIFWTLCSGGALVLPGEGQERDLHELTALIQGQGVTHTLALPSLYGLLLRETRPEQLASLRCVIVAGEACPSELVALHHERLPDAVLFNEYGPTEATVWATVHRCEPDPSGGKVPIGRAIRNARVYLLDDRRRLVPYGVPGEMYLGGPGLARGYLGRPELTAERFVDSPFGGGRLYRTGDLARYRADGCLDFLGRVDHQVKIRGYRIELEEIEDVLRRQPGVRDAAVAAREDTPGDLRLVGYVAGSPPPEPAALQERLRSTLPDYMVPAAFVVLDELPLMPNGKVDRKALPEPDDAATGRPPYRAPRNPVEEVLAEIWSDVLGAESIGVDDNFFLLGGHSLLVTQLVFRVRDNLGVELPLRAVFEAPTLGALTDLLLADPAQRERAEQAAALLGQLSDLSEEEVDAMLEQNAGPTDPS